MISNEWPLNSKDVGLSKCEKIDFCSVMGPAGLGLKFSASQEHKGGLDRLLHS